MIKTQKLRNETSLEIIPEKGNILASINVSKNPLMIIKRANLNRKSNANESIDKEMEKEINKQDKLDDSNTKSNCSNLLNSFRKNKFNGNSNQTASNSKPKKGFRNESYSINKYNNIESNNSIKLKTITASARIIKKKSVSKDKDLHTNIAKKKSNKKKLKRKSSEVILPVINNITDNASKTISNLNNIKTIEVFNIDNEENINITSQNQVVNAINKKSKSKIKSSKSKTNTNLKNFLEYQTIKEKEKEEYNERYNSVRKSFIDRKLHIFNKEKILYYVTIPGNCAYLIKNCMTHRTNWKECQSNVTTLFNFKWQQNIIGLDFSSLSKISSIKQTVNHFEFHQEISNKCNLFTNLTKYCENKGLEVFKFIPFTVLFEFDSANSNLQMENFSNLYNNIKEYVTDIESLPKIKENSAFSTDNHVSNNFSKSEKINKIKIYSSLFDFYGYANDKLGNKSHAVIYPTHYDGRNYWIVKASDLNRGRCIKLGDSLQKIQKLVKKFHEGITKEYTNENEELLMNSSSPTEEEKIKLKLNKYRTNSVIVQKYIEKPLLYYGRKFDIRMWVIITHKLEVFAFKEGHLKTSSVPYDINITNSYVHITNYSIQKYNDNFSKFEHGNEVSFTDFQNYLNESYSTKQINVRKDIFTEMKDIIEISCRAVYNKINTNNRKYCFEVFGYDFIMDSEFNVFLLEVNTNPGLEESSPLIKSLVPRMLDDALRLTIDDIYDTKYTFFEKEFCKNDNYHSPYKVQGYEDYENLWELVCDLNSKDSLKILENKKNKKCTKNDL